MNIALRILVIIVLVLNIVSLVFAAMLNGKRSLLLERASLLRTEVARISKTLEARDPAEPANPAVHPAKDIAQVTDVAQENPETSNFWETYEQKYETADPENRMDVDSTSDKRQQLDAYYKMGPDGKPELDAYGNKITEGQGTMREVLKQIYDRAVAQKNNLNKTRDQLVKVREELVSTIDELNTVKQAARRDKATITEQKEQIAKLESDIAEKTQRISTLEQRMKELEVELGDAKEQTAAAIEKFEVASNEIVALKAALDKALKELRSRPNVGSSVGGGSAGLNLTAGLKGKVVKADNEFMFTLLELSPETMKELLGENGDQPLPPVDMIVRRTGFDGPAKDFVTRVRLRQPLKGKNIVVADILGDWQQAPVQTGDTVFF